MSLLGDLFLLIGAAFSFLGALGLLRMPDVYNRLQAGTKSITLGSLSIILGVGLHHPGWWANLLIIDLLILFTNPVGSSSIARASLLAGLQPWKADQPTAPEKQGEAP